MILIAMMLAGADPSAEAMKLGRELAEQGTLTGLLTLLEAKETDDLVKDHPELSAAEQAALRASAHRTYLGGFDRIMTATAKGYAERLTIEELRAITGFNRSAPAVHYRAISPAVIAKTIEAVGPMDFKADVIANYCKESGKLCAKR